jgi:DUF971 family protein
MPPAKPASVHAAGRGIIQFNWLDCHSGGIFSWKYPRRALSVQECIFAAEETSYAPN